MTYQQARVVAIVKRVLGWVIFIPALLSTTISVIIFIHENTKDGHELSMVFKDFYRVFVEIIRSNTGFLDYFWTHSPLPTLGTGLSENNVSFLIIYMLIFVGLALTASGARISRQVRNVRENVEDMLVVEQLKEENGHTYQELIRKVRLPHHTIFLQFFQMYILPLTIAVIAYFAVTHLQALGFL